MQEIEISGEIHTVSYRRLWPGEYHCFRDHLLRLDMNSRRLRFGSPVSDNLITSYAEHASKLGTMIKAAFVDRTMRGAGELWPLDGPFGSKAEAAFSVEQPFQGSGIGDALLDRLIIAARNRGITTLYMMCLRENARMRHLAVRHEADLTFQEGEVEGRISRCLPTPLSVASELWTETDALMTAILRWQRSDHSPVEL